MTQQHSKTSHNCGMIETSDSYWEVSGYNIYDVQLIPKTADAWVTGCEAWMKKVH